MGFFSDQEPSAPDPIFGLQAAFNLDARPNKVNLSVGLYKNEELKTPILESVKGAEAKLLEYEKTKEYLPMDGDSLCVDRAGVFVFGSTLWTRLEETTYAAQAVGGTGALRVGGEFLKKELNSLIYISEPTWPNHAGVFARCGMKVEKYPYYDKTKKTVDFDSLYDFLNKLPPKTIILLHACCHNPTGADLNLEEWDKLSDLFLEKELVPFFDNAYQGFGLGIEEDAAAIRLFAAKGHEMVVATSFSKNFSLYAERIGVLFIVAKSNKAKKTIESNVKPIIRTLYSNPPMHGAHIVELIMSSPQLRVLWEEELNLMRKRINETRKMFASALISKSRKQDYTFLLDKVGLFSFSGLDVNQVNALRTDYGIYMTLDGRINIAGLNEKNLDYVVNAITGL